MKLVMVVLAALAAAPAAAEEALSAAAAPGAAPAGAAADAGAPADAAGAPGAAAAPIEAAGSGAAAAASDVAAPSAANAPTSAVQPVALEAQGAPAALGVPPSELTPPPPPPDAPSRSSGFRWYQSGTTHFGLLLDGGVPDVFGLSLELRPWWFVRGTVGGIYNAIGGGLRGGVTLVPFYFGITPTFTVEYGRYFGSNANRALARVGAEVDTEMEPLLRDVSYDYWNFHLGLETGNPRRFVWFLRAGLSYLTTTVRNFNESLTLANDGSGSQFTAADPTLRATFPSVKTGFILYLF